MKKRFFSLFAVMLLCVGVCCAQSHSKFGYKKSGWIGFSVKIPTSLVVESMPSFPTMGSEAYISSKDDKASVVFVTRDRSEYSPKSHYNTALRNQPNIAYKVYKDNYYVISGTDGNDIYYQVTKWNGSVICTAVLTYRKSLKQYYNPACATLLKSFVLD